MPDAAPVLTVKSMRAMKNSVVAADRENRMDGMPMFELAPGTLAA